MNDTALNVTLIRGPIVATANSFNSAATPCIALAYLSAFAKKNGHKATIVDAIGEGLETFWPLEDYPGYQCQGLTFDEILARIPRDTEVVGISAMFSGEWPVVRDLIGLIRQRLPEATIVAGGEHITALTEYSLRDCPDIDVCVRGEGERTFCDLLDAIRKDEDFTGIDGAAQLDSKGHYIEHGGLPRIREVDSIPWPDWPDGYLDRFWDMGKSYGVATERDMPIMASRGCPYRCTFCSNPSMWTTRYILRDVDELITEIKHYIEHYNITALQFYDLTAITKKRWTVEFCTKLIEQGINVKWSLPSGTRSEALDHETLALLRETGCNYLVYAPESGSEDTLKLINKRIDLKEFTESVMEAKRQKLTLRTNLIIGFPHERRRDMFKTIRYGLYLAMRGVDEVSINIFSPYPGTEIFRELLDNGAVTINDEYFLALTSLNSDYTDAKPMTANAKVGARELAIYRIVFMLTNYVIGYLTRPARVVRTIRNVFRNDSAATVLEHRLRDVVQRRLRGGSLPTD